MPRIVFLSGARLPTEKAEGFQVMKMCEAMAGLGHDVELLHPWRRQADPELAGVDPFDYYDVGRSFGVKALANLDLVPLDRWAAVPPVRQLLMGHLAGWGLTATWQAARRGPDLIYTRDVWPAYWAATLGHACAFEAHLPPRNRSAGLIRSLARQDSARAVFALTSYTAAELRDAGVPPRKVAVLPDAADLDAFDAAPPREDARRQLGLPPGRPIVGYVGRFDTMGREKGVQDLVRAMASPVLRELDPLLVCVGGPMDHVPGYQDLASSLGLSPSSVRFLDRVPNREVPLWLAAVDAGVWPSPGAALDGGERFAAAEDYGHATSPLKLFEYMAAGLPIVAAGLPGVRDVLEDGRTALLVPPADPEAIAAAIARILSDPVLAAGLGSAAREEAARHTWRSRAERALGAARVPEVHAVAAR
jgi:glycosyltransferase involved in cell wall biosynthesis